jgi:hypothetical protein
MKYSDDPEVQRRMEAEAAAERARAAGQLEQIRARARVTDPKAEQPKVSIEGRNLILIVSDPDCPQGYRAFHHGADGPMEEWVEMNRRELSMKLFDLIKAHLAEPIDKDNPNENLEGV